MIKLHFMMRKKTHRLVCGVADDVMLNFIAYNLIRIYNGLPTSLVIVQPTTTAADRKLNYNEAYQ